MRLPAPSPLDGETLAVELAAAGINIGERGVVVEDMHLVLDVPPGQESTAQTVVAAHAGGPPLAVQNQTTIEDRLRADLAAIDTITATALLSVTGTTVADVRNTAQTAIRDLQRQVKDLARMNKRLIRQALRAYDSAD